MRNVAITPGSGDQVSFDGNVQRVKFTVGADGTQTDVSSLAHGTQTAAQVAQGPTNFVLSSVNTTTAQLAASASFAGSVEDCYSSQSVSIGLTCDQPGILTVTQYIDAGGLSPISVWTYATLAGVKYSRAFTANGNFIRLSFQNTGTATTTTLNLNTAFGVLPATTNLGNGPVSMDEIGGTALTAGQKSAALSVPIVLPTEQEGVLYEILATLQKIAQNPVVDMNSRQRVLIDSITGALTLATVTTVGTVSTITDVPQIGSVKSNTFLYDTMTAAWANAVRPRIS